ncbi:MAG: DNA repair protein RecO [Bacilli bacterium]|nr:DNA repair protein RecO [Bacilli bacterium]
MEITEVKGIVISEKSYGESSKILNILTKDKGVIGVISKGCKRLKSPLRSVSSNFSYASFNISYKDNKLSTLISADIINPFSNIKKDIVKLSYLNFISELTNGVVKQSSNDKIYDIFLSAILKIEDGFDPGVITNILELKYLSFLGAKPKLNGCVVCSNPDVVTISSHAGGYLCKNHLNNEYIVSDKTIKLIKALEYVDISKISKLNLSEDVKKEINDFLDDYYDRYTGLYLKSKNFLKTLAKL